MLVLPPINLARLQLESTSLVRLRRDQHVLEVLVWRVLDLLLVRAHEAHLGCDAGCEFGILELESEALLARDGIAGFGDFVAWPADFDEVLFDCDRVGAGVACFLGFLP